MKRFLSSILVLSGLVFTNASVAAAQEVGHVALSDLTVDGDPPPDLYRAMFSGAIEPTIAPIVECYRARLAQRSGVRGNLRLRLWVSARQVIRVTPEASTIDDADLQACAIARIREFRLPDSAPSGGAAVAFVLGFTITGTPLTRTTVTTTTTTTTTVAPAIAEPPTYAARATVRVDRVRGGLTSEAIVTAIPGDSFDACPAGVGDLPLTLSIVRGGRMRVTEGRGTLRARSVVRCMLTAVRAIRMPVAPRATTATITISLAR